MSNKIILKKSSVMVNGTPKVPLAADLEYGELAINYAAGQLYYKNSNNQVGLIGGIVHNISATIPLAGINSIVDSFNPNTYGTVKYLIQAKLVSTGEMHYTEVTLMHNNTGVFKTESNIIFSGASELITTTCVKGSNVELVIFSRENNVVIDVVRIGLPAR